MNYGAGHRRAPLFFGAGGFSLFEVLAVLVILGIMAGTATPTVGRIFDNMRFRQQVENFSAVLRYGKLVAVTRREVVALRLGEGDECVFVLSGAVEESRDCDLDEEDVLTMAPGEIFFYPQGTATPALLTFEKGERVKRIRLDLLTARPRFE